MQQLYYNGSIITMREEGDCPQAVLVTDGVITAVGTQAALEARCADGAQKIDLQGRTLMPSFIDGHGHISVMAQMSATADLSGCMSFDEIVQTLRAFMEAKQIPRGELVMGFGYDHNFLAEGKHPTREVLDRVSAVHPVYICHTSSHMGCANSLLLERAGITAQTPDIDGGAIGRAGKEPNGYLEENAMLLLQEALSEGQKTDMKQAVLDAEKEYFKNGITTIQDGATTAPMLELLHAMAQEELFRADIISYPLLSEGAKEAFEKYPYCAARYHNHFKLGGYKIVLDGSPQGKSAWLSAPYEGEESYRGYPWMTDGEALSAVRTALNDNRQLLAHCNGDAAAEQYLSCYEQALEQSANPHKNELRPVMIHCQTVRDDQLDRMAALAMIPSIFVAHVYYWGDVHMRNLGERRGSHISPVKAALKRGLCVNFHQDAPVVKPLMLHTVWAAVNRVSRGGNVIGADQKISVFEALKAVTVNAAYEYGEEKSKGTLEAGKRADMVILSQNPLRTEPMSIKDIRVLETIKDGNSVYRA